jgi:hypothetical protein
MRSVWGCAIGSKARWMSAAAPSRPAPKVEELDLAAAKSPAEGFRTPCRPSQQYEPHVAVGGPGMNPTGGAPWSGGTSRTVSSADGVVREM